MKLNSIQSKTLFHVLADEIRLRIIRLLATTHKEACLCELVDSLLEPADKLSRHLIILRQSGLLLPYTDSHWVYYRLALKPSYLEMLYKTILTLPDPDHVYKTDLTRFNERMCLRDLGGRCRVGILTDNLKVKLN
jgi:ArsR family transcriptional regulator